MRPIEVDRSSLKTHLSYRTATGFTLIELVAVMVIVATLGMFALPKFNHNDTTLPSRADQLKRVVRHAQALAMNQGRTLTVDIQSTTRYAITDGISSTPIRDPGGELQLYTVEDGVTLAGNDIEFDSLGRPTTAGNLVTDVQIWTLNGSSNSAIVSLQPLTGFITVSP